MMFTQFRFLRLIMPCFVILWISCSYTVRAQSHQAYGKRSFSNERKIVEEIPLWESLPPNGPGPMEAEKVSVKGSYTIISRPRLIVHRPASPNGIAVLVISGGGYAHIEAGNESGPAAEWLKSQGITAFELIYRLPGEGWATTNVPFQDGQRAMRLIRSMTKKYQLDPEKVGVMGFSAGGHLAGMLSVEPNKQWYVQNDKIDAFSARPDFSALIYPVLTMMPPYNQTHSERSIIGKTPDRTEQRAYSVELHVKDQTPPVFLAQAEDDPISNVQNSHLMYDALQKHHVPSELHIFSSGGHGWGMGKANSPVNVWPDFFIKWLKTL